MEGRDTESLRRFKEKLDRELKSGLVSLVLLLVIDRSGPAYGYRILQTIERATGGRLAFQEGTAYPLLNNLERMGLVTSFWGTGSGGPPRKYYQTTALGKCALDEALEEWFGLIAGVEKLLRGLNPDSGPASPPTPLEPREP